MKPKYNHDGGGEATEEKSVAAIRHAPKSSDGTSAFVQLVEPRNMTVILVFI